MNKYKHKIPKDDLKRFAKDLAKKLVNSDFKAGRVTDPTKISEKQQKKVKQYCKDYFDKAASKHKKMEAEKAGRKDKPVMKSTDSSNVTPAQSPKAHTDISPKKEEDDEDVKMSDIEDHETTSPSESVKNGSLKRKRSVDPETILKGEFVEDDEITKSPAKKVNIEASFSMASAPPPPPPPAPPADSPPDHDSPDRQQDLGDEHGREHLADNEPDVHADSNFKSKSMADVRALAQMEDADDEVDWGMDDDETGGATIKGENGLNIKDEHEPAAT